MQVIACPYNEWDMYYTSTVNRIFPHLIGLLLTLTLAACGSGITLPATPKIDSSLTSRPVVPSRELQTSLPKVCECVLRFDHLNIEQGLSQSSVKVIFQDSRGFLWFGTEDGLNRYDGYTFKVFKPDPDVPDSISDRWITAIVEDKEGYLWIGTRQGGLNRYDPRHETFIHYTHDSSNPNSLMDNHVNVLYLDHGDNLWVGTALGLNRLNKTRNIFESHLTIRFPSEKTNIPEITSMYQDAQGEFWVGTSSGLKQFDPTTGAVKTYLSNPENLNTISYDYVTAIVPDTYINSILWVGTRNGLNRFDTTTGRFDRFLRAEVSAQNPTTNGNTPADLLSTSNQATSISSNVIKALKIDSTGNLWIGTANGLNRYEPDKGFVHYFNDPAFSKSLSNDNVLSLYEDRSGVLWIGTSTGGVNIYDRQRDLFAYYRHDPQDINSISGNTIFPIYVDAEGYAWLGIAGAGLDRFDWHTNHVIHYHNVIQDANSLGSDEVSSIYQDQDGFLWVGTYNGLDRRDRISSVFTHYRRDPNNPDSLSSNTVYKVYVDHKNNVWVGTSAGLDLFDRKTDKFIHYAQDPNDPHSLSGPAIFAIFEDQDGNLWVGTFENGLNRLDHQTGSFTQYRYDPNNRASLSNDSILSIYQDTKGRIWIGTAGGGLDLYHPDTDSFTYYLEKDGLVNGVVYGILEDDRGYLWLSTNYGISRFNPDTGVFKNFNASDGLQSNEFNSGAYAQGKDGEFYFGGVDGLNVFLPDKIVDSSYAPQVALTSLTQDDKPLTTATSVETVQAITLQWPQNLFEFDFAALGYNQIGKNQYAYLLEGFDTNWHFIGAKRSGRYTNLPGGQYTLLLKATNNDGVWIENPTRIAVTVIPPFWQTNWFRMLMAMGAVLVLVGGVRLRTKSIQDRNRQLERLVRERTSALEKRNQEIQALYQADERILRNVSLNQVFQTLVDVAVDTLDADRSVVFAWDEGQTKVVPRVSRGFSSETLQVLEFAKGEGMVGKVLETGKPVIVRQIDMNDFRPDIREALIAEGVRSFVHLPIIVDQKIVGVFNIGFIKPNLIGDDITRLFSALTQRASISIANMELFEQTKDLAVMEERNRLARDLHDSAKQKAFAALAQLGTARGLLNGNGNSVTLHLSEAENLVSDVIQELTFLIQEIYPIALQEKGLPAVMREYAFEWENRNDIKVNLALKKERRLPLGIEQALYRVTQESLANVARHSQASRVDISLVYNGDSVQLLLSDNGRGFDAQAKANGMGLRSIRERVGSIHGTLQVQSAPGQGTRIIVQAPTKS